MTTLCKSGDTQSVLELFETPWPQRDDGWRERFYDDVVEAAFATTEPKIFGGPDGFPYFRLVTPETEQAFEAYCVASLLEFATDRGIGIAFNPGEAGADWVFTYGDLFTLRHFGMFEVPAEPPTSKEAKEVLQESEEVMTGAPSDSFLPPYARDVLRHFLKTALGVESPKVLLMHRPSARPSQQLIFNLFPEDFETEEAYTTALQALKWFLPRHYGLTGVPQDSELAQNLFPL